ncbi:hemerythrin-like metal-binding protein [[Clostridium] sordellii]|uniref:bacteriohemerythrin n=1 Tax=Paraclostridium sordellii TaxID=1505 RepID=UPI0005DEEF7E|nr:bacteriohemerythrin [Paeniclostridium sordellii]CEN82722.1 hemerythrin-like metal-binding protein [[Clostridium] sordellii] [Paeniclostridium sordellii]CEO07052.1 hemerythrin-like metal-binding protein [[Clostridium] sordellii] [Paeniclostridium sordellii]
MIYKWSDELLTGNTQIDTEHKELIKAINDLLEACSKGKGRAEIEKTVKFLSSYTKTHFGHEEVLQMKYKYPDFENHKKYHKHFVDTVDNIQKKLLADGPSIALVGEINSKVANWIISHIKREDVKVAAHIRNNSK